MHPLDIALILLSAILHLYWNLEIKRSPAPDLYAWCLLVLGPLMFAPFALGALWAFGAAVPLSVPAAGWYCMLGTGILYAAYFTLIAMSYRRDDLSRAYPIARGVAPMATALWGVLFHHEHPSLTGWAGITCICAGVLVLVSPVLFSRKGALPLVGILAAVGTGLCTSGYAAVDKEGVKYVAPTLYIMLTFLAGAAGQALVLFRYHRPLDAWHEAKRGGGRLALAAAAMLGGYLLILWVLQTEPVSYVIPLRSVGVLLSIFTGSRVLKETGGPARFVAGGLIVAGIFAIALA